MTTTAKPARRTPPVPPDPRQRASAIAEAVDEAWHGHFGGSSIEIPIGVVAALALVEPVGGDGPDLTGLLSELDRDGFTEFLRGVWCRFALVRPDLLPRTKPLWRWLDDDPLDEHLLRAVHATGRAAMAKGQLALTGVADRRQEVDLLGSVLQVVRSRSARGGLGQFLTPVDVTEMIGNVLYPAAPSDGVDGPELSASLVPVQEGHRVLDPCCGSGTMLLGAAKALRCRGVDPALVEWWANDIDWLAAACCAINVHLWGLGPRVVVGCGDGLTNDWIDAALKQRQAAIDEVVGLWRQARMVSAMRSLLGVEPAEDPLLPYLRRVSSEALRQPTPAPPHSSTFDAEAAYRQARLF